MVGSRILSGRTYMYKCHTNYHLTSRVQTHTLAPTLITYKPRIRCRTLPIPAPTSHTTHQPPMPHTYICDPSPTHLPELQERVAFFAGGGGSAHVLSQSIHTMIAIVERKKVRKVSLSPSPQLRAPLLFLFFYWYICLVGCK